LGFSVDKGSVKSVTSCRIYDSIDVNCPKQKFVHLSSQKKLSGLDLFYFDVFHRRNKNVSLCLEKEKEREERREREIR
jgi:hypothetical protein